MADIYGANLYNRYLQAALRTNAQMKANSGGGQGTETVDDTPKMTSEELGGSSGALGVEEELPEGCSSILVCTGVYSRDQQELPSDTTHTVTEQRIFHGHRDFRFDPSLTQPSFIVHDVKDAVELVFKQEGRLLE